MRPPSVAPGATPTRQSLDRLREDFTKNGKTYDVVFDAVGKHSFRRCRRSLNPGGVYITVDLGFMYHVPLVAVVTRFVGRRRAKLGIGRYRKKDLLLVKGLIEAGKYRVVIDRIYALDEVVEATRYVEAGPEDGQRRAPRQRGTTRRRARREARRASADVGLTQKRADSGSTTAIRTERELVSVSTARCLCLTDRSRVGHDG